MISEITSGNSWYVMFPPLSVSFELTPNLKLCTVRGSTRSPSAYVQLDHLVIGGDPEMMLSHLNDPPLQILGQERLHIRRT